MWVELYHNTIIPLYEVDFPLLTPFVAGGDNLQPTTLLFSDILKQNNKNMSLIERWENDKNPFKILNDSDIKKFNPYHDHLGRFTSGGSATSFTYKPGSSVAHDRAITREKERMSAGGTSQPKAEPTGRGHIPLKSYNDSLNTVKQELGCNDKQATKYIDSVASYTSENYTAIRAYQTGKKNDYTKKFSRDAKTIEDYIDKAPKWNDGTLYRGINVENGDVKSLFKPGTELDMQGTSSWSSEKGVSETFTWGSGTKVIFQCDKISKATSVTHISNNPSEKEVLVSKDTKYVTKKISKKGRYYYVYLDEVTSTAKSFSNIMKFNPYHDSLGRFSSGGSAASFTYKPGASTAHSKAIEREKEKAGSEKGFKGTLYHGSPNKDIKEFDMSRAGQNTSSGEKLLFFTDSKQMADDFSYERLEGSSKFFQQRGKKGRVYEVDVEMKNPLDLRKLSDKDIDNILKLDSDGILTKETVKQYANSNHQLLKAGLNLTSDSLKELGYDGLIANTGKAGHNSLEYAVVDSKQAKIKKSFEVTDMAKSFSDILKFNPYHDSKGRFTSGGGGTATFMTVQTRDPSKQHMADKAIARAKEQASKPKEPKAMTEQEYLGSKGVADSSSGWILDKLRGNRQLGTQRGRERFNRESEKAEAEYQKRREQAKQEYKEKVKNGELRDKTKIERMIEAANGHPDNPSTQAARRMAEKRGIDWKTGKQINKSDVSNSFDELTEFNITKADDDKRLVFGWALVSATSDGQQIIDHQGDIVDQDELEEGAYEYVLNFRDAGEEHIGSLRKKARMVESVVFTEEKLKAMGIPQGTVPYGWWIGLYVDYDDTWEKIKSGHYKMFSIEGKAVREPVDNPVTKSDNDDSGAVAKTFSELMKFNPYHDSKGRFTSGGGGGYASFTFRTKDPSKQHMADKAIARMKEQASGGSQNTTSGGVKAIRVTAPDGTVMTYRDRGNGHITDLDGVEPKNTNNLSIKQIHERAKQMGYKVETFDDNQLGQHDSNRAANRKQTDDLLDSMSAKDRSNTYRAPRKGWKGH